MKKAYEYTPLQLKLINYLVKREKLKVQRRKLETNRKLSTADIEVLKSIYKTQRKFYNKRIKKLKIKISAAKNQSDRLLVSQLTQ